MEKNDCPFQQDYILVGRECYDCDPDEKVKYEKCLHRYDCEYKALGRDLLCNGNWIKNERTGKNCLTLIGGMMKFNLSDTDQFPILTTKKMNIKPVIGELIGFIRGYDNAADFRNLNCKIWDANANDNDQWLSNPNRKGEDDLGRIYGVQARDWRTPDGESVDQLKNCIEELKKGNDNRRLIVSHWNPGEMHLMALPPCHMTYQFCLSSEDTLDLVLYQRSCDFPIGIPFNIASYALLLKLVAQITSLKVGTFTHMMSNIHIYEDQYELFKEQMQRDVKPSPTLEIPDIKSLKDLETWVTPDDFKISNYDPDPFIKYPFSV